MINENILDSCARMAHWQVGGKNLLGHHDDKFLKSKYKHDNSL